MRRRQLAIAAALAALARAGRAGDAVKGGGKPMALVGDDARAVVRRDVEHWTQLVKSLNIRPE